MTREAMIPIDHNYLKGLSFGTGMIR